MDRVLLAATSWVVALPLLAQAPVPPAPSLPVTAATAVASQGIGSKVWVGRYAEFEEFLRTAEIERVGDVPVGVTKPKRAFFVPGGIAASAVVKHLPMGHRSGFWEAYKSEIAAYELDRLLELDMVPPTVERRVGPDRASVQLWVEKSRVLKEVDQGQVPRPVEWAKQVCRQRLFDNLIGNIDRNAGNMLVDGEWNIILIDHSRAFGADRMPFEKEMARVDRAFFERLKALDEAAVMSRLRPWVLADGTVRGLLKRRDRIVAHFEKLARERGEDAVFPPQF